MTKVYHIVRGRRHIASVELYTEGSCGNICVERPHESPTWFDWFDSGMEVRERERFEAYLDSHFKKSDSMVLVDEY